MENSILWLIQPTIVLIIGFFIARKMQGILRGIVIRLMPMRHRVSQSSYEIQTRFTTIAAIILAISIAIGLDLGIRSIKKRSSFFEETVATEKFTIQPLSTPLPDLPNEMEEISTPFPAISSKTLPSSTETWYIQINAFSDLNRANQQLNSLPTYTDIKTCIGIVENDLVPYKVLIGPFSNKKAVNEFFQKHDLHAFPRRASSIIYFIE